MSFILKISYQQKHKKYRYICDKPVNFNQIRSELGINHASHRLLYIVQSQDISFSLDTIEREADHLAFRQQQLVNYLKTVTLTSREMLKIKVTCKQQPAETQKSEGDYKGDEGQIGVPLKLENLKSRSEEINIEEKGKESISNTIQLTQQFFCSSLLQDLRVNKSKQLEELEQQLMRNSLRIKLGEQKKRYTNIGKLYEYWQSIK